MAKKIRDEKYLYILLILLIALFVISGCTGKRGSTGKREEKIILRWSAYAAPGYNEFRASESKKFEKLYPNVIVKYEPVAGSGFRGKILAQIAAGVAPDVFFCPDFQTYINKGVLLDLTEYIKEDKEYLQNMAQDMGIKKDVRFFDYDYDGAFIHSKIQTATDIRIAKYDGRPLGIPASARPKIGQTVIWAKHPKP